MKIKTTTFTLVLLIPLLTALVFAACGRGDKPNTVPKDPRQQLLNASWGFLEDDLTQTQTAAENLKAKAEAFCSGSGATIDEVKEAWKTTYSGLLQQDFFDFIDEYSLKSGVPGALRKSLVTLPADTAKIDTYLSASGSQFTETEVKTKGELLGLPVVEYLLYKSSPAASGNNDCKLLKTVTTIAAQDISSLKTAWEAKKEAFLKPETSKKNNLITLWDTKNKAIDEILQHIKKMLTNANTNYVATPAALDINGNSLSTPEDASKTLAPHSKLGGYFIAQFIDGIEKYYNGGFSTFKADDFISLETAIKQNKPETATSIDDSFKKVKNALKPFLSPNNFEDSISTKKSDIKNLIATLKGLEFQFQGARDALGTADTSANGDND